MEMMPFHRVTRPAGALPSRPPLPPVAPSPSAAAWTRSLPTLRTPTCTLRELTLDDAPSLFAELTTEEVARFISPPPADVAGFEAFIRWTHLRRSQGRFACFGVVPAGQSRAVGMFQVKLLPGGAGAEWGFALGRSYWGTGLFLTGARRVVDFIFGPMGITRLDARAVPQNVRGNGALRKLGAVPVGVLPQTFERHGVRLDQTLWTITRAWWTALTSSAGPGVH